MKLFYLIFASLMLVTPTFGQKFDSLVIKVRGINTTLYFVGNTRYKRGNDFSPFSDEKPAHWVVTPSIYVSKYEVTFAEYDKFCEITGRSKPNDNGWGRGNRPVINVSWEEAILYCQWLSNETGYKIRLPTEAEWEYVASGGGNFTYAGSDELSDIAWFRDNSNGRSQPVGQKIPNAFGLYDMSGNVWEWCLDWYAPYKKEEQVAPMGAPLGTYRVFRGGSWIDDNRGCRIVDRNRALPTTTRYNYLGFRIVVVR